MMSLTQKLAVVDAGVASPCGKSELKVLRVVSLILLIYPILDLDITLGIVCDRDYQWFTLEAASIIIGVDRKIGCMSPQVGIFLTEFSALVHDMPLCSIPAYKMASRRVHKKQLAEVLQLLFSILALIVVVTVVSCVQTVRV